MKTIRNNNFIPVEPILISQFKSLQNYFFMLPENFYEYSDSFSKLLYKKLEAKNINKNVFRITKFKNKIILLTYLSLDVKEEGSDRDGLFLIIGLAFDYKFYKKHLDLIRSFTLDYYELLQENFSVFRNKKYDNKFFYILQHNNKAICHTISELVSNLNQKYKIQFVAKSFSSYNLDLKIPLFKFKKHIIIINGFNEAMGFDNISLLDVFLSECIPYFRLMNINDISNVNNFTNQTIMVSFFKRTSIHYSKYKGIKMIYRSTEFPNFIEYLIYNY